MTNLRDWQKKASERRNKLTIKFDDYNAHKLLDAEIDLLLQIIEKQSEALELIKSMNSPMGFAGCPVIARTTQAEVQGLVEKITGEK